MKNNIRVAALLALAFTPAPLLAKAPVTKITITAFGRKPIEITDPKVVSTFNVWSGPGTSVNGQLSTDNLSFIIDWAHRCGAPVGDLQHYVIRFYADGERLLYTVDYALDAESRHGYVYLPGRSDDAYRANTRTIYRGVEGNWFSARTSWDEVAIAAITNSANRK